MSRYQQAKRQRQDLKTKANQLRQAGRTSGNFSRGNYSVEDGGEDDREHLLSLYIRAFFNPATGP